jgi:SAM-dependent methyltransferase
MHVFSPLFLSAFVFHLCSRIANIVVSEIINMKEKNMKAKKIKRLYNRLLMISLDQRRGTRITVIAGILMFMMYSCADAQDLDVPYVSTPHSVVEEMLDVASVGSDDYVIDLGCGDGRIVIAAAERGAYGHGIDLDPERISEARKNAKAAGVQDKVMFLQEDLFKTDFSRANVITMYLLSSVNLKLRPILLERLEPGTKIVSHNFDMGDWKPDKKVRVDGRGFKRSEPIAVDDQDFTLENWMIDRPIRVDTSGMDLSGWIVDHDIKLDNMDIGLDEPALRQPLSISTHTVYYWVIPADVEGRWSWQSEGSSFTMSAEQKFQEIDLNVKKGNKKLMIKNSSLTGERIAFTAVDNDTGTKYVYNGRVNEGRIKGKVQIRNEQESVLENWSAGRE